MAYVRIHSKQLCIQALIESFMYGYDNEYILIAISAYTLYMTYMGLAYRGHIPGSDPGPPNWVSQPGGLKNLVFLWILKGG